MRNLRILIIDDQDKNYDYVRHIDSVPCITASGKPTKRLTRWTQHLQWYIQDQVPSFDLLLIDVDFSHDGTALYDSDEFNPYGLLHALPLAARQHALGLPFAWAIGTAMRKREDQVAVFAYGLLCAMGQRVAASVITREPYRYFQNEFQQLKGPDDQQVFLTLMQRYREQVKVAAENGRIEFDVDELREQLHDAEKGDRNSMKSLLDSSLTLYIGYNLEEINLRSVFADFDGPDDNPTLVAAARSYFKELLSLAAKIDIYQSVTTVLRDLRAEEAKRDGNLNVNAFVNACDPRANLVKMGILVCSWLEEYIAGNGKKVPASAVTHALGFKEQIQVHEILRKGGIQCPLGHYLQLLASRPSDLQPSVYNCAARYWEQLKKPKNLPLPGCLQ